VDTPVVVAPHAHPAVNGEEIAVPFAAHLSCPKCGEVVLRFQDAKRLGEDAIALYRKKHGLLSANEIRAIREGFELTQADLARLLRVQFSS
jgi:DNA-binding transcriptional regulator YiaG